MIATEIAAAIRPYSMALAPDAPFMKREASLNIGVTPRLLTHEKKVPALRGGVLTEPNDTGGSRSFGSHARQQVANPTGERCRHRYATLGERSLIPINRSNTSEGPTHRITRCCLDC